MFQGLISLEPNIDSKAHTRFACQRPSCRRVLTRNIIYVGAPLYHGSEALWTLDYTFFGFAMTCFSQLSVTNIIPPATPVKQPKEGWETGIS